MPYVDPKSKAILNATINYLEINQDNIMKTFPKSRAWLPDFITTLKKLKNIKNKKEVNKIIKDFRFSSAGVAFKKTLHSSKPPRGSAELLSNLLEHYKQQGLIQSKGKKFKNIKSIGIDSPSNLTKSVKPVNVINKVKPPIGNTIKQTTGKVSDTSRLSNIFSNRFKSIVKNRKIIRAKRGLLRAIL
ncbi:MAG: hypothetical protein N2Z85_01830 [Patescibacteria group bacterium]|nr:hypothetical protein [Patescibacteria group bacterium]